MFLTAGASVIQTLLENAIGTIQKMGKGELKAFAEGDLLENLWKSYFQNLGADYYRTSPAAETRRLINVSRPSACTSPLPPRSQPPIPGPFPLVGATPRPPHARANRQQRRVISSQPTRS